MEPSASEVTQPDEVLSKAYARLAACGNEDGRVVATADLILAIFDQFYRQLCEYPYRAKRAFEAMDPHTSIRISRERLGLYSQYIAEHGPRILQAFPELSDNQRCWEKLDRLFLARIAERYEADIAFIFANSLRRNIDHGIWRPVAYSFPPPSKRRIDSMSAVDRRLPIQGRIDATLVTSALKIPDFAVPFRDLPGDVERIRLRVEKVLYSADSSGARPMALDVVEAGFFRDRTAFVVARWVLTDGTFVPFVVALLNSPSGIYADAVLHRVSDIHNLFSSALANFHVTTRLYYQTCVFLFSLMPRRPFGHQYSTIGYNHVGKVAILNEINEQVRRGHRFQRSPGAPGTVALGFTFDECAYHLKVIRDKPTNSYKWGAFPGVAAVSDKYRAVHEINRAGSMLDNVMYFNLRLDRNMFDPSLLDEICSQAAGSVQVEQDGVYLRLLIVELKIVPLRVYLGSVV